MPYITQFDSFGDLETKITELDTTKISENMKSFNEIRQNKIYSLWENLLKKI
jgi:hypothetical protein